MKRLLQYGLLSLFVLLGSGAFAQQFSVPGGTGSNAFPLYSTTSNRVQNLYLRSEFGAALPYAGFITKVYFYTTTATASATFTDLTVKLGNTTATTLTAGTWVAPMTTVLSAPSYTFTNVTANSFVAIPITPFFYDGSSNIVFEMSQNGYTTGLYSGNSSGPNNHRMYGALSATGGNVDPSHIGFGVDMIPAAGNNASANSIVEPVNFCPGTYDLKVLIKNNGNNAIDTVKINWTLDGVPQTQINFTTSLPSALSAPLNQAVVNLGPITFNSTAYRTVKVWTSLPNGVNDTYHADDTTTKVLHSSLSGVYTIGGAAPNYTTLNAAAADLRDFGVCGPVTFNIRNGTYTNQQANLSNVNGASAINRITFQSETNNANNVTFNTNSTSADNYIFNMAGTDYVSIRNLTLNPTNANYGRAISVNGSSYDSVINCNITLTNLASSTNARAGIFANGLNNHNVYKNIVMVNPSYGVYQYGVSTVSQADSNIYDNITITDPYAYGFYNWYNKNLKITNCTITRTPMAGSFYGIYSYYGYDAMETSGNKITVTGSSSTLYGIIQYYHNATALLPGITRNNVINLAGSSTTYGLGFNYSPYQYHLNNTVVTDVTGATCYTGYYYNSSSSYAGCVVENNIFWSKGSTGSVFYTYSASYLASADYNNVFGGQNLFQQITLPALTTNSLAAYNTSTNSQLNSISYNPGLTSATNLAPNPANDASWSIQGRGNQYPFNPDDINGNPRPTSLAAGVPDLGAYEFTSTTLPPLAVATPAVAVPGGTQAFTFGQDTVAVLKWAAASAVPTATSVRYYSGVIPPGLPAGSQMFYYTDVSVTGTGLSYQANSYYQDPQKGTSPNNESTIRMASKNGAAAWISYPGAASSIDVVRNILTVDAMTTSNLYTGRVDNCSGTPGAFTITNPPMQGVLCAGQSSYLFATDPNIGANIIFRWQSAPTATGPWTSIPGATTLNYITPPLYDTTYFRIVDTCTPSNLGASSLVYRVNVANPRIDSVRNGNRCGPGVVGLQAFASTGSNVLWYDNPTAQNAIAVGTIFNTPVQNIGMVTYYAEANIGACKSQRFAVTSTVTAGPSLLTIDTLALCNNQIGMLTVTSPVANFDSFAWSPITNLFVDAAATTPYLGTNLTTVYYRTNLSSYGQVFVRGFNLTAQQCSNIDTANVYVAPAIADLVATRDTICVSDTTTLLLNPINFYAPGKIRWQTSSNGSVFTTIPSQGLSKLTTGTISTDTFYKAIVLNSDSLVCFSDSIKLIRAAPAVLSTRDTTRCGPGTAVLVANANAYSNLNWYSSLAGGLPLFTGPSFTTPILPATTTFYVAAQVGGIRQFSVGEINPNFSTSYGYTTGNYETRFTVTGNINLSSVDIFSSSPANTAGSILVLRQGTNVQVASIPYVTNGSASNVAQTITLNVPLGPGLYYLMQGNPTVTLSYNYSYTGYPLNSQYLNITSNSIASYYSTFYNWKYTQNGCESVRVPVTATVTPSAAFSVTDTQSVCNGAIATLTVLSPAANYNQVTWSPTTNLYINNTATVNYSPNTNASTVYARTTVPGYVGYMAIGLNTASGCQGIDTSVVLNLPTIRGIGVDPDSLCYSGSSLLSVQPSSPYRNSLQWYTSVNNGATYTIIPGATDSTYQTPVLLDTTFYRVRLLNSVGATCQDFTKSVIVKIPTLTSTTPNSRCGFGTVDLRARSLPGYNVNWYSSATDPNPIFVGGNFTTPFLRNTTDYYVSSGTGGTARIGEPNASNSTSFTTGVYGLMFDAFSTFTLDSVYVYPQGSGPGTIRVDLVNSANVTIQTATVNITGTVSPGIKTGVGLGFIVPPGTDYRLVMGAYSGGVSSLKYESSTGYAYPYTLPGVATIKSSYISGSSPSYYFYFYDWKIKVGCSSPRQLVTATVNPAPLVNILPSDTVDICFGDVATFTATSLNPTYKYLWQPVQVPGATLSAQPNTSSTYQLYAVDTSNGATRGCAWYDTVYARVNPTPAADAIPFGSTNLCAGDSLRLETPAGVGYSYQWIRNGNNIIGALDSVYIATAQGAYSVRVTLGNCTVTAQPQNVVVNPLPQPVIVANGAIISTGSYAAYQWLKSGQTIYGATGQSYLPTANGDYQVAVTDANGCTNTSSVFRLSSLGISVTNALGGDVSLFPNPVATTLTIKAPMAVKAVITTADGRVVLKKDNATTLNVSHLADGVYFIRIYGMKDGSILKTEKLLKAAE